MKNISGLRVLGSLHCPHLADGEACPGQTTFGLDRLSPLPGRAGSAGKRPDTVPLQGSLGDTQAGEIQELERSEMQPP